MWQALLLYFEAAPIERAQKNRVQLAASRAVSAMVGKRQQLNTEHKQTHTKEKTCRTARSARCVSAAPQSSVSPCCKINERVAITLPNFQGDTTALEFPSSCCTANVSSTCIHAGILVNEGKTVWPTFKHSDPHPRCKILRASLRTPLGSTTGVF